MACTLGPSAGAASSAVRSFEREQTPMGPSATPLAAQAWAYLDAAYGSPSAADSWERGRALTCRREPHPGPPLDDPRRLAGRSWLAEHPSPSGRELAEAGYWRRRTGPSRTGSGPTRSTSCSSTMNCRRRGSAVR